MNAKQAFDAACERSATIGILECRVLECRDYMAGVRAGRKLRTAGTRRPDAPTPRVRREQSHHYRTGLSYGRSCTPADYHAKAASCATMERTLLKAIDDERNRPW